MTGRGILITNVFFLFHFPEGNDWVI